MSDLKCDAFLVSRGGIETKHESKTSRRKAAASGDGKDFCSPDSFTCNVLKMSGVGRRTRDACCSRWCFWRGNSLHLDGHTRVTSRKSLRVRFRFSFFSPPRFSVYILQAEERLSMDYRLVDLLLVERGRKKKRTLDVSLFLPCCGSSSTNYFPAVDNMHTDALFVLFERKFLHKSLRQLWKKWLARVLASFIKTVSRSQACALS